MPEIPDITHLVPDYYPTPTGTRRVHLGQTKAEAARNNGKLGGRPPGRKNKYKRKPPVGQIYYYLYRCPFCPTRFRTPELEYATRQFGACAPACLTLWLSGPNWRKPKWTGSQTPKQIAKARTLWLSSYLERTAIGAESKNSSPSPKAPSTAEESAQNTSPAI